MGSNLEKLWYVRSKTKLFGKILTIFWVLIKQLKINFLFFRKSFEVYSEKCVSSGVSSKNSFGSLIFEKSLRCLRSEKIRHGKCS
jgi:hypothetical protein